MEEQFGWKVDSNVFKILDTQDLHFLRKARMEYTKHHNTIAPEVYNYCNFNIYILSYIYFSFQIYFLLILI